jgi:light-regulated signal transduction histidine kinase (bacteriophytochrome)
MGQLIDDLLHFSRIGRETLQPVPVDFEQLARSIFERIPEQDRSHVKEFVIGPLPTGWGDYAMLRQLLENLLGNAVKFTRDTPQARIEVSGQTTAEHTVYCVKDNGVGFDPRYAHKLFGVFQRLHTDDEFEGTGVGLAIVQRIIKRHHGLVRAEGALNAGAAFCFYLPHKDKPENEPGKAS